MSKSTEDPFLLLHINKKFIGLTQRSVLLLGNRKASSKLWLFCIGFRLQIMENINIDFLFLTAFWPSDCNSQLVTAAQENHVPWRAWWQQRISSILIPERFTAFESDNKTWHWTMWLSKADPLPPYVNKRTQNLSALCGLCLWTLGKEQENDLVEHRDAFVWS